MKVKKYLFWLMMILAIAVVACEDDDPTESCEAEDYAEDFQCPETVDAIATFCTDGVNPSYYTFHGEDYYCDGVDESTCADVRDDISEILLAEGCGSKKSTMEASLINLSTKAENLLEEVRINSVCN